MKTPKIFRTIKTWFGGSGGGEEGSWRGPFNLLGRFGGSFEVEQRGDGWQRDIARGDYQSVPVVYACVMLNSRAVSQCAPAHMVKDDNDENAFIKTTTSPASRILYKPNAYETFSQLILNTVAEMLFKGECLWFVLRDDRNAITSVHRVTSGSWQVQVDPETKAVFYAINSNSDTMESVPEYLIPARDCAHYRMHCPRHPLMGETPIKHAAIAAGINVALSRSQMVFFNNMNRASGILETDEALTLEQKNQARSAFEQQSKSWDQGGVPVLSHGVKYKPLSISSQDAQLVEAQKMSISDIANVFGVPTALLNQSDATGSGTEVLINNWLSVGLGSMLQSIEDTLMRLFDMDVNNKIVLDPTPLLRIDYAARIEALAKGVQNGIMTPEEARKREGLGSKDGADELYMQRQMTPMSILRAVNEAELDNKLNGDTPPAEPPPKEPDGDEEEKNVDPEILKAQIINMRDHLRKTAI